MKKTASLSLFIGLAVSIAALYLAFRQVPFSDLMAYLKSINYFWIIPTILLALAGFTLRVYRWQLILGSSQPVGFWQAFHPLMIGFMLNCILPGRVGEVARPIILQQKEQFPFSTGLATVAAERTFDAMILLLLFSWMLTVVQIDPVLEIHFGGYVLNKTLLDQRCQRHHAPEPAAFGGNCAGGSGVQPELDEPFVSEDSKAVFFHQPGLSGTGLPARQPGPGPVHAEFFQRVSAAEGTLENGRMFWPFALDLGIECFILLYNDPGCSRR